MSFQNLHMKFHKIWPEHLKVSKLFTIIVSFWGKYLFFELKKYRRIIFHETEEGYKSSRGANLSFQNWHKAFGKVWPEHSKISKIFNLMVCFWEKYILFGLKKYRRVICHETEEETKVGDESTCCFKIDIRNFIKFYLSSLKS